MKGLTTQYDETIQTEAIEGGRPGRGSPDPDSDPGRREGPSSVDGRSREQDLVGGGVLEWKLGRTESQKRRSFGKD